ncbi:MAG: hypothetical protein WEB89_10565 [Balneolales bacterium]
MQVRKYHLKDQKQDDDDQSFWDRQTPEYKISVVEALRVQAHKLNLHSNQQDANLPRLRRVIRIVKQTQG